MQERAPGVYDHVDLGSLLLSRQDPAVSGMCHPTSQLTATCGEGGFCGYRGWPSLLWLRTADGHNKTTICECRTPAC